MGRNQKVEAAVKLVLGNVDSFIGGQTLSSVPNPTLRHLIDDLLKQKASVKASVRLASLFLVAYSVIDPDWDWDAIPTGIRGQYGDKLLADSLSQRQITLHDAITAFGENLGWKGNVQNVRLSRDPRFGVLASMVKSLDEGRRRVLLEYMASKFAESRREQKALPAVGADVLTFARAKSLLAKLLSLETSGHVQQFLIAAMLRVHRARYQVEIKTHHPHAPDKYDETAGDIEEHVNGQLTRAYEVTVRPDWKNRVSVFREKMDRASLPKYVIIASNVNNDEQLAQPAKMLMFLEPYGRDIAVVDIQDFANVFAAELTAQELRQALNLAYDFLCRPDLCGIVDYQEAYNKVVEQWLDQYMRDPSIPTSDIS
jgi:hypothetical protein